MTSEPESADRRLHRRAVAWALGLALLLGTIETVKGWVAGRDAPNAFGWDEALLTNLPWWLLWGLAALLVFRLVRRFPLRGEGWPRAVAAHVGASVGLSLLHLGLSALIVWAAVSHAFLPLEEQVRRFVVGYLMTDLVTYWAIAAAYGAWLGHARARRAERERQELEVRNARLEARMSEARLAALRRELNPHFLFNALNTVSALASRGDGDRAVTAIARLSELLRRVLDDDLDERITVGEEVDLLELYLDLVRLRYGDRLSIRLAVDPAVRDALVPALVLQPLAENAVKHGVESVRGPAELRIEATGEDGRLVLLVGNSGPRLRVEEGDREDRDGGVGLRNTRDRLRTLYGPDAAIELRRGTGGGAEAVVRLPLEIEREVRLRA